MDLKKATKTNAKHILKNLSSLNKWCKDLSPITWGVLYALKTHTKGINQFLYGVKPDLNKVNDELKRLKGIHPNWTNEDIKIEVVVSGNFNTIFADYMTTILLCKAANKINKKESFLKVVWEDEQLRRFAWNISHSVNCKSLEEQMWIENKYNQILCLYVIRECLRVFLQLPRNTSDITVKHGGSEIPKKIPSTILHRSFLSTDYVPKYNSMWTMNSKHIIHIPAENKIPLLFIEACIHGEENEIMLPPGICLHYTSTSSDGKILNAKASLLQKYWIGMNGLTETKPNDGPYIMIDWNNNIMKDTLPEYKLPTDFNEFVKCVTNVFPAECILHKTKVTGGNKVKNILQLAYHSMI
mgnify:CR=1 FL=1